MFGCVWGPHLIAECICRSVVESVVEAQNSEESSSMKDYVISGITPSALPHWFSI